MFGGEEAGRGSFEEARFVVLPVPLELTVSYGSGTARGPSAILRASEELEYHDEETGQPYWQPGEVMTLPSLDLPPDPESAVETIHEAGCAGKECTGETRGVV